VTVGFTAGIAVIIFASQIHDLLGITLAGKEPGELIPKLAALGHAIGTTNTAAVAISLVTIGIIVGLRKLRPTWPGMLIAVALTSVAAAWWSFPVETIGTRFGGIPQSFPMPSFPEITLAKVRPYCPMPSCSPCWAPSSRCCPPSWPTA
jgi:SulP family sulfate permease